MSPIDGVRSYWLAVLVFPKGVVGYTGVGRVSHERLAFGAGPNHKYPIVQDARHTRVHQISKVKTTRVRAGCSQRRMI